MPDLSTTKLFVGWPTLDEVDPLMAEAFQYGDWDEDGNLDGDEFAAWWVEAVYIKEAVVNEHFDWYDLDGDEIISVDEVLDGRWVQDLPDEPTERWLARVLPAEGAMAERTLEQGPGPPEKRDFSGAFWIC